PMGTVVYMSPEQVRGEPVDYRSDIWALGVLLYEMLCGQHPFGGEHEQAVIYRILNESPRPLRACRPRIPAHLEAAVAGALARDKARRFASMEAFCEAILGAKTLPRVAPRPSLRALARRLWKPLVVAAIAATVMLVLHKGSVPPTPPPRHTQLTFLGDAGLPALSPDGRFLAFTRGIVGSNLARKVYVKEVDRGRAVEVLQTATAIWDIDWSPDGTRLLIATDDQVLLIPRLGGNARRFAIRASCAAWAPDGSRFAVRQSSRELNLVEAATGKVTTIPLDSNQFHPFGGPIPSVDVDWSPDGDWLLFDFWEEGRVLLALYHLPSGKIRVLYTDSHGIYSARWSPREPAIYFLQYNPSGTSELWKLPVDLSRGQARGKPRYVAGGMRVAGLSFSRDGKRLVWSRLFNQSRLWLISNPAREQSMRLLSSGTAQENYPALSPDGSLVAFQRRLGEQIQLFVRSVSGGPARQVTFQRDLNILPAWSPDGKKLAFLTEVDGQNLLATIGVDGSNERIFPRAKPKTGFLAWKPGSRIVYEGRNLAQFHLLDPESGSESLFPAAPTETQLRYGLLSPDGRSIAFITLTGAFQGLVVASLESGLWQFLKEGYGFVIGWTRDGKQIYFQQYEGDSLSVVWRVPADGSAAHPALKIPLPSADLGPCTVTADGKSAVCPEMKVWRDLWLVENFDPDVQ
ncbi:MAG: hypothetical protein D6715_02150, partial [Calditrichaeota bacterium]